MLAYAVRSRLVEENVARLVPNPEPKRPEVPVFDSLAGMERDESHHHVFRKTMAVVTTVVTRSSHSGREIDDGLARMMANQLRLQLGGFWQLVDCPLDEPSSTGLVRGGV